MSKPRRRRYTHGPHVYARGGRYYLHIPPVEKGQPPERRSLNTDDPAEAERRLGEYLAGRGPSRAPASATAELPLARIVEAYLTAPHGWTRRAMQSADNRAAAWLEWCHARGLTLPSHLTGDHAQQWVKDRLAAGVRHSTFNRDRSVVRGIFQWASHPDRALCAETAFARLPQLREDRRERAPIVPSPREIRRTVEVIAARGHERPPVKRGPTQPERPRVRRDRRDDPHAEARIGALYVALTLATGARISEIGSMRAEQLHPGAWTVPPSKGHAERSLPLDEDSERAAREMVALLTTTKARNGKGVTLNERWALDLLTWACWETSVPRFKPHDLRRTFATECRRAGLPVTLIRDLMGHKDTQTTERYFGRYREDDAIKPPVPAALRDLVAPSPANVIPLRGAR